jgi:hypothetical protein
MPTMFERDRIPCGALVTFALTVLHGRSKYEISCEKGFLEKLVLGLRECLYISYNYDTNMDGYATLVSNIP